MPPKRASSGSTKRKASEDDASSSKRAKTGEFTPANGQPNNKTLPVSISFPAKTDGALRIAAWNICGLAASQKKGFKFYVEAEDPDVLVLTETKVNNEPVDPALKARFPHCYWAISATKTYSGTAILSKHEPISVDKTLPGHPDPSLVKGRIVTLEFPSCYLVATYVPNAGAGLKTLDVKKEWNVHFTRYIRDLDKKKPVMWTGDLNVAPTEIDLANAKTNWNKTAGYTEAETTAFKEILNPSEEADAEHKFVDVWRKLHPDDKHYTYWSYRFNCRYKGIGWRLDFFVLSERLVDRVKMCEIRSEIWGASDHCPLVMEIDGQL
ncbi:Endonuclease/exonuclease/phosphatase [Mucidula mucida]|nr:Endonuclease/exonuclease/phosphatase [Mucidula mucida]